MGFVSSSDAILALRAVIFDGPTDKLCSNKDLVGIKDGVNPVFKTFEYRRLTDFKLSTFPLGVFKNGVQVVPSADDLGTGAFQVAPADIPGPRDTWTATYYYQWFLDDELDVFLTNASNWLGLGTTYANVPNGLNPSMLDYAAREAYRAAAMKTSIRLSQTYKMEDAPTDDIKNTIQVWSGMAKDFLDSATTQRNDFYERQGQPLAPLFAFSLGRVKDPTPRR